ncbi:MAG: WD40 repeat domain-containing protein [Pseudomonadota bacterium]
MNAAAAALVPGAIFQIEDFPTDLAWSPDSGSLVIGGGEGKLLCVDVVSGAVSQVGMHVPGVLAVDWQPKGSALISAGQDGTVRLWNMQAGAKPGEPGATLQGRIAHKALHWPTGLGFRSDGQRFAFVSGRDVLVFDAAGQQQLALSGHGRPLSHLAWRGRDELVAAGNGAIFVDRTDAGGKVTEFLLEGTPVTLAVSPDLKVAASGLSDGTINFRHLNSQKRSRMSGYEGKVHLTAWSANSRLLATASTGATAIVVWDFSGRGPEGTEPLQLNSHEERIEALAWQGVGPYMISAGRDWRVVLWRPGSKTRAALDIQLLDGPAGMACWSPDGKRLAVAQPSGKVRVFSLKAA